MAVNCCVAPVVIDGLAGVTAIELSWDDEPTPRGWQSVGCCWRCPQRSKSQTWPAAVGVKVTLITHGPRRRNGGWGMM